MGKFKKQKVKLTGLGNRLDEGSESGGKINVQLM